MSNNYVQLVGNVVNDPQVRYTQSGKPVANFRFATNETWESNGQKQSRAEFHRIVCWSKAAERASELLVKGTFTKLTGSLRTRSWDDRDGNKRYTVEIHVFKIEPIAKKKDAQQNIPEPPSVDDSEVPF